MMRTPTLDLKAMTAAPAPEFTSPLEALVFR
jgi:hypothetical protein